MSGSPFAAPKDGTVTHSVMLCGESSGSSAGNHVEHEFVYECPTHGCSCVCFADCFPLAGSLPFTHNASRFAPSKNRLRTVARCNRKGATDVSLGFLHSN